MGGSATLIRLRLVSVLVGLAPAVAAAAESPGPGTAELAKLVVGLAVVIVGVLILARVLARMHGVRGAGHGDLRIVAAVPVGQKERIVLMQVGGRQLLLGVTPAHISRLHELEAPLSSTDEAGVGITASSWLGKALARRS